ncbi:Apple domain-containing protein [Aphelenchoides fujianensis]|nr:Apple domain-containing protein [Aphelenchoides fujianensis]
MIAKVAVLRLHFALLSSCPISALNGGNYDEIATGDIGQCCIACARDPCCIAYTVDKYKNRCYLKAAITDSTKSSSFTSGLKANVYSGRGSSLKNIRIQGGTSTTVKLPNNDECVQFCTAYGMSSFTPAPEGSEERNGDCSCMSRISSLEYFYGARSSIFPTDLSFS